MIVYSFINHIGHDVFRPLIATIIGQCYNCIQGRNWDRGLSFTL